jgi:hypothetical protein
MRKHWPVNRPNPLAAQSIAQKSVVGWEFIIGNRENTISKHFGVKQGLSFRTVTCPAWALNGRVSDLYLTGEQLSDFCSQF